MEPDTVVDSLWDSVKQQLDNSEYYGAFSAAMTFGTNPVLCDLFADQVVEGIYTRLLEDAPTSCRVEVVPISNKYTDVLSLKHWRARK